MKPRRGIAAGLLRDEIIGRRVSVAEDPDAREVGRLKATY